MLLTSLYGHKLQFISHKVHPLSSSHGQLCGLVFFSCTKALIFLEHDTRLLVERAIWALLFVSLMTPVLVQSPNKMHLKYVFCNKFRMIMPTSWIKNTFIKFQKQGFADTFQNRCSLKFCNSCRKTLLLELLFN